MEILFLSHCVPGPPEKGEKIRAYFELQYLAAKYRVHLACFARSESEVEWARTLTDRCASVYVELLRSGPGLARAAARFAIGNSLTASFYSSAGMRRHAMSVARQPIVATVPYSSVMAQLLSYHFGHTSLPRSGYWVRYWRPAQCSGSSRASPRPCPWGSSASGCRIHRRRSSQPSLCRRLWDQAGG